MATKNVTQTKGRTAPKKNKGAAPPPTLKPRSQRHSAKIPPEDEKVSANKGRFTPKEDDFIKDNYGFLTLQKMAYKLGRSVSGVHGRAKKLGLIDLKNETTRKISVIKVDIEKNKHSESYPDDWLLRELEELQTTLKTALDQVPSSALPRLAGEYRETIKDIDKIQKQASQEKKGSLLNDLKSEIKKGKPRAAN